MIGNKQTQNSRRFQNDNQLSWSKQGVTCRRKHAFGAVYID